MWPFLPFYFLLSTDNILVFHKFIQHNIAVATLPDYSSFKTSFTRSKFCHFLIGPIDWSLNFRYCLLPYSSSQILKLCIFIPPNIIFYIQILRTWPYIRLLVFCIFLCFIFERFALVWLGLLFWSLIDCRPT